MRVHLSLLSFTAFLVVVSPSKADFALRDGDTIAFMGDSITAARQYGKIIENYTLLRYPNRKVKFINVGQGGDTAAGGLARLDRDVFQRGATVLTVAYGINDIGWGLHADDAHRKKYLDSIRAIVEECKKHKVRVYICSAAITAEKPDTSEKGYFQKMCDEGMEIAKSLGEGAIDVQRMMRGVQRRVIAANANVKEENKKTTLHAGDGIHLNELGQMAMAYAILKGLGAPADVSSVSIDAAGLKVLETAGCTVDGVKGNSAQLEFTRRDEGLPINFGLFGALNYRFVPIPEEINRYMLTVKNLPPGKYDVEVEDRLIGTYSAGQLAKGLNICSATTNAWNPGGPWDAQSTILQQLTDARSNLALGDVFAGAYLPNHPDLGDLKAQVAQSDAKIVELQRSIVKPRSYHFVIKPAAEKKTEAEKK